MTMWQMRSALRTLGRTVTPRTPTLSPPYGDVAGALDPACNLGQTTTP